jgi:hypothetical protein
MPATRRSRAPGVTKYTSRSWSIKIDVASDIAGFGFTLTNSLTVGRRTETCTKTSSVPI